MKTKAQHFWTAIKELFAPSKQAEKQRTCRQDTCKSAENTGSCQSKSDKNSQSKDNSADKATINSYFENNLPSARIAHPHHPEENLDNLPHGQALNQLHTKEATIKHPYSFIETAIAEKHEYSHGSPLPLQELKQVETSDDRRKHGVESLHHESKQLSHGTPLSLDQLPHDTHENHSQEAPEHHLLNASQAQEHIMQKDEPPASLPSSMLTQSAEEGDFAFIEDLSEEEEEKSSPQLCPTCQKPRHHMRPSCPSCGTRFEDGFV